MNRLVLLCVLGVVILADVGRAESDLKVGFGEVDVTPLTIGKPVWLAGFGQARKATGVHDPIMVRAFVLDDGTRRLALASVDVVGLFRPVIVRVRQKLPELTYLLVSSTHNHEGPDTLGLWGPNPFTSGIDPDYLGRIEAGIVQAVRSALANRRAVTAKLGTARAPELLHDTRPPIIKHDELTAIQFRDAAGQSAGVVVVWNCHPETLDSRNTLVSADYVAATVADLRKQYACPVVYLTGTVGGLMTSLHVPVLSDRGEELRDGTFAKTTRYGQLVAQAARRAIDSARPVTLTPLVVRSREVFLPVDNPVYQTGWYLGVLDREIYAWADSTRKAEPIDRVTARQNKSALAILSEIAWLSLGEWQIAAIPGEIYPELVLGHPPGPADPNADFPDAPPEPTIYARLPGPHRTIIGLANDEIGYIIPRRQWDTKPPFAYGAKKAPYGEINSLGPRTAPLLCEVFAELVAQRKVDD